MRSADAARLLGVLALTNVVMHRSSSRAVQTLAAAGAAAVSLAAAVDAGADGAVLGVSRQSMRDGIVWGGIGGAAIAGAVAGVAALHPQVVTDRRPASMTSREAARYVLMDMPLITVVPEEIVFRSALPVVLSEPGRPRWQIDLVSAVLFGAWHLLPYRSLREHHPGTAEVAESRGDVVTAAAHTMGLAVAGAGLDRLRRRSDSLLAPVLVHWSVNAAGFAAARWVARRRQGD